MAVMISVSELDVIFMEEKMNKVKWKLKKRIIFWLGVFIVLCVTAVTVYAVMPGISLNSSTSFPVDI